jgi:proteic killer suppression protein
MIRRFRHPGLQEYFIGGSKAGIRPEHAARLRLVLGQLNVARTPADMDLPGLRLHALKGAMSGRWSVAVSANWRITFAFDGKDVDLVDYEDYH